MVLVGALGGVAEAADCLTSSGKTACGFHCVASDGEVRCAQTAEGICSVSSGVVVCWDPPAVLRRVFGGRVPQASCVSSDGQTACGYGCETTDGHVLCAQTPFGQCDSTDGKLACWDPPAAVILAKRGHTPQAECVRASGKVACGYHCQTYDGAARCSETPEGTCSVEQGHLVCWDPPLDTYEVSFEPAAELACLDGEDGRSCGYRCVGTSRHSACGATRADSCRVTPDGIQCRPPD